MPGGCQGHTASLPAPQSVFTLGAAAGGLSTMLLNDCLGRKLSIMFSALPSALGYALLAGAQGLWMLLLGRVLTGYAGGVTSASIPVTCQGKAGREVLWVSWGLQGRRCCNALGELGDDAGGSSLLFGGSSRALGLCLGEWGWGGCSRAAPRDGQGVPAPQPWHGAEPVGAGFPRLQERQGSSSAPAPPSSYFLPNTTLCFTQRGRQELSNTRAPLSSNGGIGELLPHRGEEGSAGAARAVLSSGQIQLEPSAPHPKRAIPQQFGFPLVTGYGCEVTQGRSSG